MAIVETIEQLEALYGTPSEATRVKEVDRIVPSYRALIEASPFAILATAGPEGLDCSPRGDLPGFVRVADEKTLMIPDRRGNNRVDSLRNILRDPRMALLFLLPGSGSTLRVNGQAVVSADPALLESFMVDGKLPRSVVVATVEAVFFQCSRAVLRADLWNPAIQAAAQDLPSAGRMLAETSAGRIGGEAYDQAWLARAKQSMW
ncbi:MAG: pyridoxamine 5'-phosphate oxidase family protein [Proteobacteria bacterium]|nr:pyridoxamine 5'-phosphate oxidase family protein [Pseudomonadota bacterium]